MSGFFNFDEYYSEFDESFGFFDADYLANNQQSRLGLGSNFNYKNGSFHANFAYSQNEREFESSFPAKFESSSIVLDVFNKYTFNLNLYSIIGVNHVSTDMNSYSISFGESGFAQDVNSELANDHIIDPYINLTYLSKSGFNLNAGLRFNNHSEYKSHLVYSFNPSYTFKIGSNKLKIMSSYNSAYITPSLYQLFAPGFGNPDLEPQEDKTIEAGLALNSSGTFELSVLYFNRSQDQYIDFAILDFDTFEGEYQNSSEDFNVDGIEVELSWEPISSLNLRANYTFTERKEAPLFRIPKHKGNLELAYAFGQDSQITLNYQYNGIEFHLF